MLPANMMSLAAIALLAGNLLCNPAQAAAVVPIPDIHHFPDGRSLVGAAF